MLGKLYTDMSGAYWFLRRPQDGIACLEKSIGFFEKTEHVLNSIIAYNNLGINLMLIGECDEAKRLYERLLSIRNDVGLLSEEYDVASRRLVGNFPQAFSHVALINTAHNLKLASKPAKQRADTPT